MSLSLNCSPAYWSFGPFPDLGVNTGFPPSDKWSDLTSTLCCARDPIWLFLIASNWPTVFVVAEMFDAGFPLWWLGNLPLTLSYSRLWLVGPPWCDLGFFETCPVTEPSLLPPLGLSISTELLYTSTEWPRCLEVALPWPIRPLWGLLAPIIF